MNPTLPKPVALGALSNTLPLIILAIGLLGATLVYYPGLSGPLVFDDTFHIQDNPTLRLDRLDPSALRLAVFSTEAGPFQRPLSMASFALNFYFFGESTVAFKITNLVIHLINGVLIFLLCRQLLQRVGQRQDLALDRRRAGLAAALTAAVWLVHPLNLTSVLYVVQRMASLSALFVLLSLLAYLAGRLRLPMYRRQSIALFAASALCWLCGVLSKENALLLPWYIFLIEWLFFYPIQQRQPPAASVRLYTFAWLLVPLIGGLIYLALHPGMLNHDFRPFTLTERLLTEARALWFYLGMILLPRPMALGLYHDDFPLSTSLLTPWTTLPAILGLLLAAGFALRAHRQHPLLAFGILFFLAAHALESSIFPLEIMHEHRNYLASAGFLFGIIASLTFVDQPRWNFQPKARLLVILAFFAFFSAVTLGQAINWGDFSRLMLSEVDRHPESAYANNEAGRLYLSLRNQTDDWQQKTEFNAKAVQHFLKKAALLPQDASGLVAALAINAQFGGAVDPATVEPIMSRLRNGSVDNEVIVAVLSLSWCERKKNCVLPNGLIEAMFQALLANPRLSVQQRATLLDELALRAMDADRFTEAETLFKQVLAINSTKAMFRINYAVLLMQLGRLDEAQNHLDQVLAAPQPAAIVQLAGNLKRHIGNGPTQNAPEMKTAPSETSDLLLEELMQPKGPIPFFDFNRNPNQADP